MRVVEAGETPTKLSEFTYDLPEGLIAQEPAADRSQSRLLVVNRRTRDLHDSTFANLPEFLQKGDLLVANQSRVIPARIFGRLPSGGAIEVLLIRKREKNEWEVMARPARKLVLGTVITFPRGVKGEVIDRLEEGRRTIRFSGAPHFDAWLASEGRMPIPPYIKQYPTDPERYQTVYSTEEGSVAAPTAGLHFTPELISDLRGRGVELQFVTLHVGPGTFQTPKEDDIRHITLEPEYGSVTSQAAEAVCTAKQEGRRVITVGTTTTRLLEGVHRHLGEVRPWKGRVDLLIRPPFEFRVANGLITNFHLPRSTLLLLVSAFAGRETVLQAYAHAVAHEYRFYSFGDAMLLL